MISSISESKGLVFDLEVVPSEGNKHDRIIMMGAVRSDSGIELELKVTSDLASVLKQLDEMSEGANFVLGHNIIEHDLPILREHSPDMAIHNLPVIDTLRLSPLAFPQNPYHRLVKDYKLIRDSLNSPLSDCRSTLVLFQDQRQAFTLLKEVNVSELLCYQALLAPTLKSDLGAFFVSLTGQFPATLSELRALIPQLLAETDPSLARDLRVCRSRLDKLLDIDLERVESHWAVAYVLAWLRVSGGNSVLAPWVRHQFPEVQKLISELRDVPCEQRDCKYCQTTHDPRYELKRYFGFQDFRYEKPGMSLQHDIVLAGMRGKHVLAILATGGGKSLCYQLPALNRFHRNGSLTIIISPLQSLMKDQVDGLLERNIHCAATLNGLLTMPERADVLEKVQMGDVGILLVSPEQFRNKAFIRAIRQRQIGAWIFDEAHCLSKWGSDFRPDYLYVSRFIRQHTGESPLAQIGCFTATAKPDVLADIKDHFRNSLGIEFETFHGGHERTNLHFDVLPCVRSEKWLHTDRLLHEYLDSHEGGAVVFVSGRKSAEDLSDFLIGQGWACRHFHAGLEPNTKTDIQDRFKAGGLRVIVATNAFGMGVDKADIRLVVHADIPGSLENYLQEAGRAGRDQSDARCVLLYDPQDIETQFGMSERSKLSIRDIQQILRKLRNESSRRKGGKLVITAGEILLDENVDTSFSADERDAETKVVTAVAWLERGDYLKREENHTQIFPGRLIVNEEDADKRLLNARLPKRRLEEFRAILHFLFSAGVDERVNTDQLMQLTSMESEEVASALNQLEDMGLLVNDSLITLYIRHGVAGHSSQRLQNTLALEVALLKCLPELMPDADQGSWQDLNLPALANELKTITAIDGVLPLHVLRLLRSLSQDHDANGQQRSSFELRQLNRDHLKLRIKGGHSWKKIVSFGETRRILAEKILQLMIDKLPPGLRGADLLVETSFGELQQVIENDLELRHKIINHRRKIIEHVLLYLHRQDILALNHGMTVMRRAMTIEINKEDKRKTFLKEDYFRLDEHYREKRIQVHVMREYAEEALKNMGEALRLILDYFTESKQAFIKRYFSGREDVLKLATSEESWKSIIGSLSMTQKSIVADDEDLNRLVLAGPGSGKTRVIVHRIAYLLRVRRVSATSIVALTFNRHAANEIRKRLLALVGADAYGVNVLTYHSMAMRLTGTRFERSHKVDEEALKEVLNNAVELLEGKRSIEGEDDLREQLLRGYRYILVDEYQDIDDLQYRLVSALAGRHAEEDGRLCIMAVGDDDQNIYAWRDTNNLYIERFKEDYMATTSFLIENYRSSQHIIDSANKLISQNSVRLKEAHNILINNKRSGFPAGGEWEAWDETRKGRVIRLCISPSDYEHGNLQAQAAIQELERLLALEFRNWSNCAILARTHRYLWPVQAWCEQHHIPYFLAADKETTLPIIRQRNFVAVIEYIKEIQGVICSAEAWHYLLESNLLANNEWKNFFETAFEQMRGELGDCQISIEAVIDWIYDYAHEMRQQSKEGLYLGTVHSAKGLEFRHIVLLDGGWKTQTTALADERRLYYVGMTRAEQTLTICEFGDSNPFSSSLKNHTLSCPFDGAPLSELEVRFKQLSLTEIDIGFAGRHPLHHQIHNSIKGLHEGDSLTLKKEGDRYHFIDEKGHVVGRTTKTFQPLMTQFDNCEVAAVIVRFVGDSEEQFKHLHKCERWEVVIPRIKGIFQVRKAN